VGSRLKRLRRDLAPDQPIALTDQTLWKEDLLSLNHILGTMGFPASMRQSTLFPADEPRSFVPGVRLATAIGRSVDLKLYPVPGELGAAQKVWHAWLRSVPHAADGAFEEEFFSRVFFNSIVANADFVEGLVRDIESAGIEIPKLREYERSGRSPVPNT